MLRNHAVAKATANTHPAVHAVSSDRNLNAASATRTISAVSRNMAAALRRTTVPVTNTLAEPIWYVAVKKTTA